MKIYKAKSPQGEILAVAVEELQLAGFRVIGWRHEGYSNTEQLSRDRAHYLARRRLTVGTARAVLDQDTKAKIAYKMVQAAYDRGFLIRNLRFYTGWTPGYEDDVSGGLSFCVRPISDPTGGAK